MTAEKRKAFRQVLAIGIIWLAIAGIAWALDADSKWILFAVLLALASFLNLGRVALLPENAPRPKTADPAVRRKGWILLAAYFGVMVLWIGGFVLFDGLLTGLTSNARLAAIFAYLFLMGIAAMIVFWGISAKLGLLRFRPRRWVRRLFNIPDDYQPPEAS